MLTTNRTYVKVSQFAAVCPKMWFVPICLFLGVVMFLVLLHFFLIFVLAVVCVCFFSCDNKILKYHFAAYKLLFLWLLMCEVICVLYCCSRFRTIYLFMFVTFVRLLNHSSYAFNTVILQKHGYIWKFKKSCILS